MKLDFYFDKFLFIEGKLIISNACSRCINNCLKFFFTIITTQFLFSRSLKQIMSVDLGEKQKKYANQSLLSLIRALLISSEIHHLLWSRLKVLQHIITRYIVLRKIM